jgi:hypothetical protein
MVNGGSLAAQIQAQAGCLNIEAARQPSYLSAAGFGCGRGRTHRYSEAFGCGCLARGEALPG